MKSEIMSEKKLLYEISIIRPLIIFLLVVYHSFCIFTHDWEMPQGVSDISLYWWIGNLISGFRIETIALVAGYVFSYQCLTLKRRYSFKDFIIKKFKRLIIPCLTFGVLYYFLLLYQPESFSLVVFINKLLKGVGHLWFLPMLFWNFMLIWIVNKYNLTEIIILPIAVILTILPVPSLPLGLTRVPHFFFYFYGGFLLWKYKAQVLSYWGNAKGISMFALSYFALLLFALWLFPEGYMEGMPFVKKAAMMIFANTLKMLYASCGIMALYLLVCRHSEKDDFKPRHWVIRASSVCYGVYVFHQFVMKIMLDKITPPLQEVVDSFMIPWVLLVVSLTISLLLTELSLKTRFGRFLIG